MKKISFSYTFLQSLKGIVRNSVMSIASVLVLASCLLVLGTFGLLTVNINHNLDDMTLLSEVAVFLQKDSTDEEINQIRAGILAMRDEGMVSDVEYVSAEDALISEKEKFEDYPLLFESISEEENPYRASFVVTYEAGTDVSDLEYRLYNLSIVRTDETGAAVTVYPIDKVTSHAEVSDSMSRLQEGITQVSLGFMLVLFVVSIFVIINTIRLGIFAGHSEISVMRYVGATNAFVTAPFIFEGLVIGGVAAITAFGVEWFLYDRACQLIAANYQMLSVVSFADLWYYILIGFLLIGLFTGAIGSFIAVSRYLKERA